MKQVYLIISLLFIFSQFTFHPANANQSGESREKFYGTAEEVIQEYIAADFAPPSFVPTPTPALDPALPPLPGGPITPTAPAVPESPIGRLITLGTKIWEFILANKPTADYKTLNTSVVPAGVTDWIQLTGWAKTPIVKMFRVNFKTLSGSSGGSFEYRLSYFYGGALKGHGKFIGQLSVIPSNIKLYTARSLVMRAELVGPINMGTEEDPVAAAKIQITWSSPTTTSYGMGSAEYIVLGTGEFIDLSHGL